MSENGTRDFDTRLDEALEDPAFRALYYDAQHRADVIELLAARRDTLGLTLEEVGRRMGVTRQRVHQIESGGGSVEVPTLQRYARAVGGRVVISIEDATEVTG